MPSRSPFNRSHLWCWMTITLLVIALTITGMRLLADREHAGKLAFTPTNAHSEHVAQSALVPIDNDARSPATPVRVMASAESYSLIGYGHYSGIRPTAEEEYRIKSKLQSTKLIAQRVIGNSYAVCLRLGLNKEQIDELLLFFDDTKVQVVSDSPIEVKLKIYGETTTVSKADAREPSVNDSFLWDLARDPQYTLVRLQLACLLIETEMHLAQYLADADVIETYTDWPNEFSDFLAGYYSSHSLPSSIHVNDVDYTIGLPTLGVQGDMLVALVVIR